MATDPHAERSHAPRRTDRRSAPRCLLAHRSRGAGHVRKLSFSTSEESVSGSGDAAFRHQRGLADACFAADDHGAWAVVAAAPTSTKGDGAVTAGTGGLGGVACGRTGPVANDSGLGAVVRRLASTRQGNAPRGVRDRLRGQPQAEGPVPFARLAARGRSRDAAVAARAGRSGAVALSGAGPGRYAGARVQARRFR